MSNSNRLPYFTRVAEEKRPSFSVQRRDIEILKAVMDHRFISSRQLKSLLWWIPERSLLGRLKKMYHHQMLDRPSEQRVLRIMHNWHEMVYSLDDRGVDLLANNLGINKAKIKWQANSANSSYLQHSLMISEFRITLTLATQLPEERVRRRLQAWRKTYKSQEGHSPPEDTENLKVQTIEREENERRQDLIRRFYMKRLEGKVKLNSWKKGKRVADSSFYKKSTGSRKEFPISPDGYFVLSFPNLNKTDHWFFEADRGTESGRRFKKKLKAYWNYKTSRSGRRARRRKGVPDYRVLTITEDKGRRDYLLNMTEESEIVKKAYHTFWFGTKEDYRMDKPQTIFERNYLTPIGEEKKSLLPER